MLPSVEEGDRVLYFEPVTDREGRQRVVRCVGHVTAINEDGTIAVTAMIPGGPVTARLSVAYHDGSADADGPAGDRGHTWRERPSGP